MTKAEVLARQEQEETNAANLRATRPAWNTILDNSFNFFNNTLYASARKHRQPTHPATLLTCVA